MHDEDLDDVVRDQLHHKFLIAINQKVYDDGTKKENIIKLNNKNGDAIELVTRKKEIADLQRNTLTSIEKEGNLGEQMPRLGIAANEPENQGVGGQLDIIKDEASLTDMDKEVANEYKSLVTQYVEKRKDTLLST